ncbi:MAG: Coenzyme F420 hydrogenase/dehydrogenase, beta subunit C-terminal domain [Candidatus Bathyarchaeota archaeon]|nr:MAG: Coenzyme F420 hydrogenase/dehydrogenase, beta subunit C-terminal domain [Candidatus Bathyarchaeota archaeon]
MPFLKDEVSCVTLTGVKKCGTHGCCFDNCPMTSFSKKEVEFAFFGEGSTDLDIGSYRKILSARSTNERILKKAQNGGTVTSLLNFAIQDQSIDPKYTGAIVTRSGGSWNPLPTFASTSENLIESAGSIYSRLPLAGEIRRLLRDKRSIIFVGTGCQTTGVRLYQYNFLKNLPEGAFHLLEIGLFCYENFPYAQFRNAIEDRCKISIDAITKMNVEKGKLVLYAQDKEIIEYPIREFESLVSEGCKLCTNFTAELADISIGSLGSKIGYNTLIIRSEEGLELVEKAEDNNIIETSTGVSIEEIRKIMVRKRKMSEIITTKRLANGQYVPKID